MGDAAPTYTKLRANCLNPGCRPTQPTPIPLPLHNANQVGPHLSAAFSSPPLSKTKGPTGPPHIPPPLKIIPTRCQHGSPVFALQIAEPPRPRPQSRLWFPQTNAHLPRHRRRQRLCHANRLDRRRTVARSLCPRRRDLSEFRPGGLWPKKRVLALSVL